MATFCDMLVRPVGAVQSDQVSNRFPPTISLRLTPPSRLHPAPLGSSSAQGRPAAAHQGTLLKLFAQGWSPPTACRARG